MSMLNESQARLREHVKDLDEKATLRARVVELQRENDLLKQAQRAHTEAEGSLQPSGTEGTPELESLQHIVGGAPIGLCCLDTQLRYVFVNEWLAAINGLSVKEHLGRPMSEVLPDVPAGVEAQLRRVIETGEPIREGTVDAETAAQPGVKRCFEHHYDAVRSADGVIVGVSCVVQDVTERKRAEEALRRSEERFDLAVKASHDGLWDWDIATGQEWWSPRFYEMLGYEDREFKPTSAKFHETLHPDDRDRTLEAVRAHLEDRAPYDVAHRLRTKSGEYRWFRRRGQVLWNETGEPLRMAGSIRDIHERRREKEALRFTQFAVDHNSEATCWVKKDGSFFYVNEAACQALEYTQDELTSMTVPDIDPDFPLEGWPTHWQKMKEARSMTFEAHHRTKAGRIFPVEILSNFVEYDGWEYICAFARDITERKRAEEQKSLLEEQLHRSQKMEALGQLASGIAHDFNNLLMVVRNCADFLTDGRDLDGPDPREALRLIKGATAQASGVTRSLLAFAGKVTTDRIVVDLGSIVDELSGLLRHLLPATIEIVVDIRESPLWVLGDESRLQQVIMNLAINSRDAMSEGGTMSITVDRVDGTAQVTVTDTGVGIPPELQSRIFEPFFSTKPRGDATGLGLAIVHGIVKDHEGEIRVQSEPGEGTTTTISLPCVQEPTPDAVSTSREIPKGQGQLVVLAEDGQHVRTVTELLLVALGYEVEAAEDGAEALAKFNEMRDQVELVILDLDMPKKTGVQCLEELRADGVDTPVLLISAGHGLQQVADSLDERSRILQKPFNIDDLDRAISEVLFQRSSAE